MSRSFKKVLNFDKKKKLVANSFNQKRLKIGKSFVTKSSLSEFQTLADFEYYVSKQCFVKEQPNRFNRKNHSDYKSFLGERKETKELIKEFALKLFNKQRKK